MAQTCDTLDLRGNGTLGYIHPHPLDFIPESWKKMVIAPSGIDRQYYEICAMNELKWALRAGAPGAKKTLMIIICRSAISKSY